MSAARVDCHPGHARDARGARMHRRPDRPGPAGDSMRLRLERPVRMGEVVVRDLRDGRPHSGVDGIAQVVRQVPVDRALLAPMAITTVRRAVGRDLAGCDDA